MKLSPLEQRVSNVVAPVMADMGFTLVLAIMTSEENTAILRILTEHTETKQLTVDDCAILSRAIGTVLDVEDIVQGAYRLEVSSPGIERPLVKPQDFVEHAGFEAKVEIEPPLPTGQKRFRGKLRGLDGENVLVESDEGSFALPLHDIVKARLVLTDELLKAGQEKRKRLKELQEQIEQDQAEQEQQKQQTTN